VKKVRAILQVVDADNGRGSARSAKRLHAINRRLSIVRDAHVMLQTLHQLRITARRVLNEACYARLRRRLSAHKKSSAKAAAREDTWRRVGRTVRTILRDARRWRPRHRQFGALAAGIRLSHQRGRTAMAGAMKRQRAVDFHDWRKQIKALWYELRLVEGFSPRIRHDVKALQRAEACLGEDHDVVVLCAALSKDRPQGDSRIDLDRVRLAGHLYQCALRKKALATARRIYKRAPEEYANDIRRAWKAGRLSTDRLAEQRLVKKTRRPC
jgi:CHAD domain-containing protein